VPSGLEIQNALRGLAKRWKDYSGTERSEAQTFLNELFACYGTDRHAAGAHFEDAHASVGIMDLYWSGSCIIEMKAPSQSGKLADHRKQALDYWRESSDVTAGVEAPPYVVLCAFQRFEVWVPGKFPTQPVAEFALAELPQRYDALMFLAGVGLNASFLDHHLELTTGATRAVTGLYHQLLDRSAAPVDELQRFVLQAVWCFFAEDLGMLDGYPIQTIVETLRKDPSRSSYAELGALFEVLNQKGSQNRKGVLAGTQYVNGDLFARPAKLHLEPAELSLMAEAAAFDWSKVNPTIFGSLLEGVLGDRRRELGAHYTHEVDILKIVEPTISRPWRARIEAVATAAEARALLDELCAFRVLDPACGCGNFLYVAYRELRGLENELKKRISALAAEQGVRPPHGPWPFVPLANMQGIDVERIAVLIARVTLWMGHRQMIDLYGEAEPPLPLVDLSGVRVGDALRAPWPETDAIVGNPPFYGSQLLRGVMGDEYVTWLGTAFGVGIKDYCVYWFRKAHEHLGAGQRAGLVGTNSIAQNRARSASLDYLVSHDGVITDAVSSQKWPGEAKVHVALVNWVKQPKTAPVTFTLDGLPVAGITAELKTPDRSSGTASVLSANKGRCFQGPIPVGDGFVLAEPTARWLLAEKGADYAQVVRPYLIGDDLAERFDQSPSRWIIDFSSIPLEAAMKFPKALEIVKALVRPEREMNARKARRERWWQFGEKAVGMRAALTASSRYIAAGATGKRLLLAWQDTLVCPSNLVYVFAFDDDYSMGFLLSRFHSVWARSRGSSLKADLRYTPTSAFQSLPWPSPVSQAKRDAVAAISVELLSRRSAICAEREIGLTALYNDVDDGAHQDLAALHRRLDRAVGACYGWPAAVAQDDDAIVARLRDLNAAIVSGERAYAPFGTGG
jgi:hypothetical protein